MVGDLKQLLQCSPLFSVLLPAQLDDAAARAQRRQFRPGEILFRAGEPGDTFYVILSGRTVAHSAAEAESLNQLGPGEWFGEMALITGEPRSATVSAVTMVEVATFAAPDFRVLLDQLPGFSTTLSRTLSHRLRARVLVRARQGCPHVIAVLTAVPSFREAQVVLGLAAALAEVGGGRTAVLDYVAVPHLPRTQVAEAIRVFDAMQTNLLAASAEHTFVLLRIAPTHSGAGALLQQADAVWAIEEDDGQLLPFLRTLSGLPEVTFVRVGEGQVSAMDEATTGDVSVIRKAPSVRLLRNDPEALALRRFARRVLKRRVGLVLSAGGAKGLAHIGALRCFERAGLEFDMIAGASIGGIIGGLLAMGLSSADLLAGFEDLRSHFRQRLLDFSLPGAALLRGHKKQAAIRAQTGNVRIEDLSTPFSTVAGDLVSGREVVLGSGPLWQALDATSAIPALFPPVVVDRRVLVDGWVVNPLPADVLRREGADIVVAVDTSAYQELATEFDPSAAAVARSPLERLRRRLVNPAIARIAMRSLEVGAVERTLANLAIVDVCVQPQVGRFSPTDIQPLSEIVARGEEAAEATLAAVQQALRVKRTAV